MQLGQKARVFIMKKIVVQEEKKEEANQLPQVGEREGWKEAYSFLELGGQVKYILVMHPPT